MIRTLSFISILCLAPLGACRSSGSGGDPAPRTRGMRLPPPMGMEPVRRAPAVDPMAASPAPRPAPTGPLAGYLRKAAVLEAAIAKQPTGIGPRLELARLRIKHGDVDLARRSLDRLLKTPKLSAKVAVQALSLLAKLSSTLNRVRDSLGYARRAVAKAPRDAEARLQMGRALVVAREKSAALHHFQLAAKLAPQRADLQKQLGVSYLANRKRRLALRSLRKAASLAPQDPSNQVLIGDTYWAMRLLKEASAAYHRALGMETGGPVWRAVALDKLGTLNVLQGRRVMARRILETCRQMFPHLDCPYTHAALLPANPTRIPGKAKASDASMPSVLDLPPAGVTPPRRPYGAPPKPPREAPEERDPAPAPMGRPGTTPTLPR